MNYSPRSRAVVEALALGAFSLVLRLVAAWILGEGAPFGPDGTGVEAAVALPGHVYPAHVSLVGLLGSARAVSLVAGPVTSVSLWAWGRRLGLGGAGGWLHATLPVAIFTGALSAGDAPAMAVLCLGALLATGRGWLLPTLGGATVLASAAVKPSALPASLLLLATPRALPGAALAIFPVARFLGPLLHPMPTGGLLGTWWLSSGGAPPTTLSAWARWLRSGVQALMNTPLWVGAPLVWLAPSAILIPRKITPWTRMAAAAALVAAVATASLLGGRLEARYLQAAVVAALPFLGAWLRGRRLTLALTLTLMLPVSFALLSQVAAVRGRRDPEAVVPAVPVLGWPLVGADELFEQCSTDGATALRAHAAELAKSLPPGATVQVVRRRDGREGELAWPLRVARPDVIIVPVPEGTPGAW